MEIKELRRWPIAVKDGAMESLFSDSYFIEADTNASIGKKEGDFAKTVDALESGFRYAEAYSEYRKNSIKRRRSLRRTGLLRHI